MRTSILISTILLFCCPSGFGQSHLPNKEKNNTEQVQKTELHSVKKKLNEGNLHHLELPRIRSNEPIIHHIGYTLSYNEEHEQANWVAYELTANETQRAFGRTNHFMEDPAVGSGSARDVDYKGSGYDRGHLAPAADMGWSAATMEESFYYSNMSPQEPGFNRGIWKHLEELVRHWAEEYDSLEIVTGPILREGLPSIGPDEVSVPEFYYKVILDHTGKEVKGIGFVLPNASSQESLQNYAVSIDSVEHLTGLDFYPLLPDQEEKKLEHTVCLSCWDWSSSSTGRSNVQKKNIEEEGGHHDQCNGITVSGNRCRNAVKEASNYCYIHQGQSSSGGQQHSSNRREVSVQCSGTTKAGNRCRHRTYNSNGRCFQHGG